MYRIGQVAARLDLSPSTIRHWSQQFSHLLSEDAGNPEQLENGRHAMPLYSEEDVRLLAAIQRLKEDGLDNEKIEEQLRQGVEDSTSVLAVLEQDGESLEIGPAQAAALGQALRQLVDTQQSLMNAQQAQRDLLGIIINDSVEVKNENERLRRRLRMMEEEMARLKESDWNHRLSLEERMGRLEKESNEKRSLWDRLLGR